MRKKNVLFLLTVSIIAGCIPNRNLDDFTLYNKTNIELIHKLKINGIYYRVIPPQLISPYEQDTFLNSFALYNNGTYLSFFYYSYSNNLDSVINNLLNDFKTNIKFNATWQNRWGAYEIKNDTLHVQTFAGFDTQVYSLFNRYYLIKDSVTLEKIMNQDSENIYEEKELNLFHFYQVDEKPDSINLFMTNKRIKKKLDRLYEKK